MSSSKQTLSKYLPANSVDLTLKLLRSESIELRISKPRKTKFGDYRFPKSGDDRHRISVNSNLNAYAFLITLVHEIAHLKAFKIHGKRIKPHGIEWQNTFLELCSEFIEGDLFPEDIKQALILSLNKGSASSCTDHDLYRTLKAYDTKANIHVEDLPDGAEFIIGRDKIFRKGPKLRKRFRCLNLRNGREYMVHPLAEVSPVKSKIA